MSKDRGSKTSGGRGVVFLNVGTKHLARLVVSLYSLRRHYSGPVAILDASPAGDRAHEILLRVVGDERLGDVKCRPIPLLQYRRNSAYVTKSSLWAHSPYDATLFMDADTVAMKDPSPLLDFAENEKPGLVVTRFSNWVSDANIIGGRIRRWAGVRCDKLDVAKMVKESLSAPHAAINTGVLAWRKDAAVLRWWQLLTQAGWRNPWTDELAMQLLIREFPHTLVGEKFNASPIYTRTPPDQVVIYHMHGGKSIERDDGRGAQGHIIWWPLFQECVRQGIAGIGEWVPAGDKHLAAYLTKLKLSA